MCPSIGHDSQNTSKLLQTRKYYLFLPRQLFVTMNKFIVIFVVSISLVSCDFHDTNTHQNNQHKSCDYSEKAASANTHIYTYVYQGNRLKLVTNKTVENGTVVNTYFPDSIFYYRFDRDF